MSHTVTHYCDGCNCRYDTVAYTHHFAHDQCDWRNNTPLPLLTCTLHDTGCPLHNKTEREHAGGWNTRHRKCRPIYTLRAGHTINDNGEREPATWLTLYAPDRPADKPHAPRPPAALLAAGYHHHERHWEHQR